MRIDKSRWRHSSVRSKAYDIVTQLLCTKVKYEISENQHQDEILANINQSRDEDQMENRDILTNVMALLLGSVHAMYKEVQIPIFSDDFYSTARFCKIWEKMTKIMIFLVQDKPQESSICFYSQLYILADDYSEVIEVLPYAVETITYHWLEEAFFIIVEGGEWPDKLIIFKFLTDALIIRQFDPERGKEQSSSLQPMIREIDDESTHNFLIKIGTPTVVASKTLYFKKNWIYPVNLRLLAIEGTPIGISIMIFDYEQCAELPIFFLIIHPRRTDLHRRMAQR